MNNAPSQLTIRISWLGSLNYLGALSATGWLLYLVYRTEGAGYAALALLLLAAVLRFGASPLFAIAASILYFHFDAAGLWLPAASYALAGLAFHRDLRQYRAQLGANR